MDANEDETRPKTRCSLVLQLKFEVPKKLKNGQKSFLFWGAKLWNSLPAETMQASSVCIFKNSILWSGGFPCGRAIAASVFWARYLLVDKNLLFVMCIGMILLYLGMILLHYALI